MKFKNNNKVFSYYELTKSIEQSKCILNNEMLDYFESLLYLKTSVIYKDNLDPITSSYLNQLKLFRDLALYNLYYKSFELFDKTDNKYVVTDNKFNGLNIDVKNQKVNFNVYNFDYKNDVSNIYLYSGDSINLLSKISDDQLIKIYENECFLSYERKKILEKFLNQNNLNLYDFDDKITSHGNKQKIKKYDFVNIIIK